ncbi:MAG: cupin domain-containing protein [Candidatus Nanopelagicales bacterium]
MLTGRLTDRVPDDAEEFHELAAFAGLRVEHIVSSARPDPSEQLQDWDEWVLVLRGSARLEVAGEGVDLVARDWIVLPAGTPHRVVRTDAGTHWVAVHGPRQSPPRIAGA